MTTVSQIRALAINKRSNVSGLTWRDWYDATGIIGKCAPNACGGCSDLCGHSAVSASPGALQAWFQGMHPREYGFTETLKQPGTASLAGTAFYQEDCVLSGILYHYHPGGYWLAFCPFRESMVHYAREFTD